MASHVCLCCHLDWKSLKKKIYFSLSLAVAPLYVVRTHDPEAIFVWTKLIFWEKKEQCYHYFHLYFIVHSKSMPKLRVKWLGRKILVLIERADNILNTSHNLPCVSISWFTLIFLESSSLIAF